jgi:hypothetical protein
LECGASAPLFTGHDFISRAQTSDAAFPHLLTVHKPTNHTQELERSEFWREKIIPYFFPLPKARVSLTNNSKILPA